MYQEFGKRLFDFVVALVMVFLLLPLWLLLALLVRLKLGSPILFRQQRPGWHGRPFTILKFRTMTDGRDPAGNLLSDANRLTPFGQFLRRTSLDELPELLNVLKGEMSLVGPRPLLMRYLPYFSQLEQRRHEVRPGITGWAQVNGRNNLSWDERLSCDVWYVDNLSVLVDIKIFWFTIWGVIKQKNVQVLPQATMLDLDEERKRADVH
ncbi:MAG TPA: sugar transferase [Chloroflexota bacterium]|nr:sugar transferase [Chloroflexota bacterium]HUM68517.1 sugar transferase [Chloroflexota bacterium]